MRTSVASLASLLSLGLAAPALALTIDNFEAGNFSVIDVAPGPTSGLQAGLAPNVIGGARLVRSNATNGGTTTATLVTTALPDDALVSFADAVAPFGSGDVAFVYDGDPDFTVGGTSGLLNLDMSVFATLDVAVTASSGASLQVTLWDATTLQSSAIVPAVAGNNAFLLSSFNALDLTSIKTIRLAVQGLDPGDSISIADFSTDAVPVPEPGTAFLLAIGLTGLGLRKARGR